MFWRSDISAAKGLSARELYHVSRLQALRTLEQVKQRKHVDTDPPITTKTAWKNRIEVIRPSLN